jgi:hypothetical protein
VIKIYNGRFIGDPDYFESDMKEKIKKRYNKDIKKNMERNIVIQ